MRISHQGNARPWRPAPLLGAVLLIVASLASSQVASAQTFKTLYSFCSNGCLDGLHPVAGLVMDKKGNLYGTTQGGGANSAGTVFELKPNADGTKWKESVLYAFCAVSGCPDGAAPEAGLIMGPDGSLYGTTSGGGSNPNQVSAGIVFKLTRSSTAPWDEQILYSFCMLTRCADGASPAADLIFDAAGNLFGTTPNKVFELTASATAPWPEKIQYAFCPTAPECPDGTGATSALIFGKVRQLLGTTQGGGAHNSGTVFRVTMAANPPGKETVLYSFCPGQPECTDGSEPIAGLIMDDAGNLYGTTPGGGAHGGGTVFTVKPGGKEKVLYSFCKKTGCTDGELPSATLILDDAGNLYGTTKGGGAHGGGTAFRLTLNAARTQGTETVLHHFCSKGGNACTDGSGPRAKLLMDDSGNLYGTTFQGGEHGGGTVFQISP